MIPKVIKKLSDDTDAATGPDSSSGSGAGEESGQLGHSADSGDGGYAHSFYSLFVSPSLSHCLFTSLPRFVFFKRWTREKK